MKRFGSLLLLAAVVMGNPGCGRKGPLELPLVLVPQAVEALTAVQRGDRILLEWIPPVTYIDGRPLSGPPVIEVWVREVRDAAISKEPAPSAEDFGFGGRLVAALVEADQAAARNPVQGTAGVPVLPVKKKSAGAKELIYEYGLSAADLEDVKLYFALRTKDARRKRYSDFCPPVAVVPHLVAAAPADVKAEVFDDRIELRWTAPASNFDGSKPPVMKGYNVYRHDQGGPAVRINTALVADAPFSDGDVVFGRACRYFVRAAATAAEPFLESEDSPPVDVLPKDVFPPLAPAALSAATGAEFITLIWNANAEKDLAGYHVWRKDPGGDAFVRLTAALLLENTYTDRAIEKGKRYGYAISAVDAAGNESARSAAVSEIVKDSRT